MNLAKVLVIGGGIGGLTAAIALRREGFTVDVIERDPDWAAYGVGIIQQSNVGISRRAPHAANTSRASTGEYGNYNIVQIDGALAIQVGDDAAFRAAAAVHARHDGCWSDGTSDQKDMGDRLFRGIVSRPANLRRSRGDQVLTYAPDSLHALASLPLQVEPA